MSIRHLSKDYAVGPQITPADVARLKAQGFATLVCNRPDGESGDQPAFAEIAAEARKQGMEALHLPVMPGKIMPADRDAFAALYVAAPKPVFAFCRTGMRAETLWTDTQGDADR
ncbi:TIGR01244 family phosphatase [Massilia sp. G4R7]|uniref:TIGR01244 family phosphatase n=1 Tax=Massilia phyllostachyos TaxID=2898585 RepID=A0ABS8Q719_9BURK|nr:TIGR01244 family sulfur transferase [Massilia phyllostachyos]MCD2517544.1 TIGR01244 family phosphatase [Massilia phyllostachyos]